jgi:nicotinamidase-related amidase
MRHEYIAAREKSLLLIIDFQQGLLKVMDSWESISQKVSRLI